MQLKDIFKLSKLERLKALQLYAKHLVHSLQVGMHQSAKRGSGIEFKEYRNYAVGDNLKQLDWKYFARTDHYMIKEAEVERLQEFIFVMDRSLSMNFENGEISKLNYAQVIIASLAYIASQQHDDYLLFELQAEAKTYEQFLYQLIEVDTMQDFSVEQMSPNGGRQIRSTVFLLTDGYATENEMDSLLKKWSVGAHQVVLIHLLFEREINLSFEKKHYRFQDLETAEIVEVNTVEQLQAYKNQLNHWQAQLRRQCASYKVIYSHYNGTQDISSLYFWFN